jgi:hypothetical protein
MNSPVPTLRHPMVHHRDELAFMALGDEDKATAP